MSIADLSWAWPVQLLERVSEAHDPAERSVWLARLAASVASG
jgi:hypothetical protein